MEYIIVIIIGVVIIWAAYAASNSTKKKKSQSELDEAGELKVRITGTEPVKKQEAARPVGQESLDSIYAKKSNLWICSRCETLNQSDSNKCAACGKHR